MIVNGRELSTLGLRLKLKRALLAMQIHWFKIKFNEGDKSIVSVEYTLNVEILNKVYEVSGLEVYYV